MNRLTVAQRLGWSFALLAALTLCAALSGAWGLRQTRAATHALYEGGTVHIRELGQWNYLVTRNRVLLMDAMTQQDPSRVAARLQQYEENRHRIDALIKAFPTDTLDAAERQLFDAMVDRYRELADKGFAAMVSALQSGQAEDARKTGYPAVSKLNPEFTELIEKQLQGQITEAKEAYATSEDQAQRALTLAAVVSGLSLLAAVSVGFVVTRSLLRQLGAEPAVLANVAQDIASGSLAEDDNRKALPGSVMASMLTMRHSLATVVSHVRQSVNNVTTASNEIAQGNADLSRRTEVQASSIQQTAASMEQLTSTVSNGADNARQANQMAQSASQAAQRGGEVVSQVVDTMTGIKASSGRIAEIIGVIDGIAFQTNILALNAAVEAARAGEQGRGFAVVASEVRTLAQRSADAARQIKDLINDSLSQVEAGHDLVQGAGQTIQEVVDQVRRVADLVGEISSSAIEQTSGIGQVGQAVSLLDQTTQQNSALVEQSAAAAESLRNQAQALAQAVSVFRLSPQAA